MGATIAPFTNFSIRDIFHFAKVYLSYQQTPRKLLKFYRTVGPVKAHLLLVLLMFYRTKQTKWQQDAEIFFGQYDHKRDWFHRSECLFIGKCLRTGVFRGVCSIIWITFIFDCHCSSVVMIPVKYESDIWYQGLTLSIWFTCPSGMLFWKFTCPAKIFTCPANICTSPVKLIYTIVKISTCPHWKITCPVGHVTTKVYVPWDKIYMPPACRHTLMSSPGYVTSSLLSVKTGKMGGQLGKWPPPLVHVMAW